MRQGEVYWADLGEDFGERPVVVLTRTSKVDVLSNVTVAPVTSTIRGIDVEVTLELNGHQCVVNCDNLLTVPKTRLSTFVGTLTSAQIDDVFGAIHVAFDMPW